MTKIYWAGYIGRKKLNPKARIMDELISRTTAHVNGFSIYSHVELITKFVPGNFSTCWSSSFRDKGVRSKEIYLNPERWHIYEDKKQDFTSKEAEDWFLKNKGKPYDLLGIFGFHFGNIDAKNMYTCSESCASSVQASSPHKESPNSWLHKRGIRVDTLTGNRI